MPTRYSQTRTAVREFIRLGTFNGHRLAIQELLQDLCKRRGVMLESDMSLSPYTVISKRDRSDSEIFISLTIPHTIITEISSSIDGKYDTDITRNLLDQWLQKRNVCTWLSRVLALHARPTILDKEEHPVSKAAKKRGPLPACIKDKGLSLPPQQSRRAVVEPIREESEDLQGKRACSISIIDISSSEDENENASPTYPRSTSVIDISSGEDESENKIPVKKHRRHAASPTYPRSASVIDISSGEDESETEIPAKKQPHRAVSPTYHIQVHYSHTGEILELCMNNEDGT
ncbi:hypothetical protein EDD85DRAFT_794856 [Armillaria nabsnona]|nr:hypothetical protein EDD85DRAFT_794856 [Armillaria nabsnona]